MPGAAGKDPGEKGMLQGDAWGLYYGPATNNLLIAVPIPYFGADFDVTPWTNPLKFVPKALAAMTPDILCNPVSAAAASAYGPVGVTAFAVLCSDVMGIQKPIVHNYPQGAVARYNTTRGVFAMYTQQQTAGAPSMTLHGLADAAPDEGSSTMTMLTAGLATLGVIGAIMYWQDRRASKKEKHR